MSDTVVIREGFLCPICMQDLENVSQLQQHFDESHSEENDVLQQLKGIFGKAKKKILGLEEDDSLIGATAGGASPWKPDADAAHVDSSSYLWEPQRLGASRNHSDAFKSTRDGRIDRYVVETNKLLIRLDKLISPDAPVDTKQRKIYEMRVVNWALDSDVNLCPTCGEKFRLTRRRHHCRLCGGIMCDRCSQFLPYAFAKRLTDPAYDVATIDGGCGYLRRTGSASSLNSMTNPDGEPHVRTCVDCRRLLERRDVQMRQRYATPPIVDIYERMKEIMTLADESMVEFQKLVDSLLAGENTYSYQKAVDDKTKLLKLYDHVEVYSKRIANLGLDEAEPPHPKVLQLQKSVRLSTMQYLQSNKVKLQNLPTEAELKRRREQRELERRQRIEEQLALERTREEESRRKRRLSLPETSRSAASASVVRDSGWTPFEIGNQVASNDDPMIQQMNIVRFYIRQAKQAQKYDEVKILEDNLKDLQLEYYKGMGQGFNSSTEQ
ncbi:rabenosyn-5-like [Tubulanus polymorphus]|uniref:rabenosyn-5-like n=1 Tax=Tubulanus polymorphus TaxID=672921 RepID=UPI003DA6ACE2